MTRVHRTIVALIVAVLASLASASSAQAVLPQIGYANDSHRATNNVRGNQDLVKLPGDTCLMKFAARQARAMANAGEIFHQPLRPILDHCSMRLTGENVAAGFSTGAAVVKVGWMNSPAHRANLLEPRYRKMAIAAHQGDDGRWYVAQLFGRKA